MARGKKLPERVEPELSQYSFESCPDAKLSACCQYEYLASSKLVRETVKRRREGKVDPSTKAVFLLFTPDIFGALEGSWWPERPYLESPLAKDQHPVPSPKRQRRDLAELVNPWSPPFDAERVVVVRVPRSLTLPILKEAFGDFVQRYHAELLSGPVEDEWRVQKRGRGSLTERARTDLKALTAWRLQKQFGYSKQAAIDLLRAHRLEHYEDVRSFRRAVDRADKKIAALEEELISFAKKVTA